MRGSCWVPGTEAPRSGPRPVRPSEGVQEDLSGQAIAIMWRRLAVEQSETPAFPL